MNLASQDEVTQKKGASTIWWMMGPQMNISDEEGRRNVASVVQISHGVPVHRSVLHFCVDDPMMAKYVTFGAFLLRSLTRRNRIKIHEGKHLPCNDEYFRRGYADIVS
jgi:hypothetical protein